MAAMNLSYFRVKPIVKVNISGERALVAVTHFVTQEILKSGILTRRTVACTETRVACPECHNGGFSETAIISDRETEVRAIKYNFSSSSHRYGGYQCQSPNTLLTFSVIHNSSQRRQVSSPHPTVPPPFSRPFKPPTTIPPS